MLVQAFTLQQPGELVALVGGGGKSSLMFALGRELAAAGRRVILTTTTRIATAEVANFPSVCLSDQLHRLPELLAKHGCSLVVGDVGKGKAKSVPLQLPARLLERDDVDVVLVEADGSKQLPVKAPAEHEPALPPGTTLLVPIAGIDALAHPLDQIGHRPHLVAQLTGRALSERLRPVDLATLFLHPEGALKHLPPEARVIPLLNKVETEAQYRQALAVAEMILTSQRIERVVIGALQTSRPVRAILTT